jgi:rhodanese-related sulfurtransferase/DNA-binding transcriptional ArsR family regulator
MKIRMNVSDPYAPYNVIAELGHVLSSPQRVRLLHLLCQCDRTVIELAGAMKESVANVSHHLQVLKKAQLVVTQRLDRRIAYGVADEEVKVFWRAYRDFCSERLPELRVVWSELAEKRRTFGGAISRAELVKLLNKGEVTLIDVRPREEYEAGHITGAISIPHSELMDRLQELPRTTKIVLYCRGPYCLLGDTAQEKLASMSIGVLRLADGIIDWKGAGLPIRRAPGFKSLIKRNEP